VVGGATSLPFIVTGSQIGVAIDALEPSTAAAFVAAGLVSDRIFPTAALAQLGTMAEGSPPPGSVAEPAGQPLRPLETPQREDLASSAMTLPTALIEAVGAWAGSNGFRLMPSDPLHEAPATAEVTTAAGGNLVAITYTWSHPTDGAQDGLLVVGTAEDPGAATAFWGDSWHQSPTPRACVGTFDGDTVTVGYEYEAGWRWQITVDPIDTANLQLRMDNVIPADAVPDGVTAGPYPAMVTELQRRTA